MTYILLKQSQGFQEIYRHNAPLNNKGFQIDIELVVQETFRKLLLFTIDGYKNNKLSNIVNKGFVKA